MIFCWLVFAYNHTLTCLFAYIVESKEQGRVDFSQEKILNVIKGRGKSILPLGTFTNC